MPPRDARRDHRRQVCRALDEGARASASSTAISSPTTSSSCRDDDREIAKVLDFGIAKSQPTALDGSNTKTGAMLGTPYYMSPEQAQGIKAVDCARATSGRSPSSSSRRSTGRLPFESEALGDLLVRIIVAPHPGAVAARPGSPGFDAWWAKASSRDPARPVRVGEGPERFPLARLRGDEPGPPVEPTTGGVRVAPVATTGGIGSPMARTIDPVVPKKSLAPAAALIGVVVAVAALGGGFAVWRSQRGGPAPVQASASLSGARNPVETGAPSVAPPPAASIAPEPRPRDVAPEGEKAAASPSASIASPPPPVPAPAAPAAWSPHSSPKASAQQAVAPPPLSPPSRPPSAPARPPSPPSKANPGSPPTTSASDARRNARPRDREIPYDSPGSSPALLGRGLHDANIPFGVLRGLRAGSRPPRTGFRSIRSGFEPPRARSPSKARWRTRRRTTRRARTRFAAPMPCITRRHSRLAWHAPKPPRASS